MAVWIISNVTLMIANFWVLKPCIPVDMYKSDTFAAFIRKYMRAWPLKRQYTYTRLHEVIFHTCSHLGTPVNTISLKMPTVTSEIS